MISKAPNPLAGCLPRIFCERSRCLKAVAGRSLQPTVWVLPNRRTPGLIAVLVAMWYAGASQGNGAAYLLCFVLGSLALVSGIHAWTNLRGIALEANHIAPVFAGEELQVSLTATANQQRSHFGVHIRPDPGKRSVRFAALEPQDPVRAELRVPTSRRGLFREVPVRLSSSYPLGFLTAQQDRLIPQTFHVYP